MKKVEKEEEREDDNEENEKRGREKILSELNKYSLLWLLSCDKQCSIYFYRPTDTNTLGPMGRVQECIVRSY